jgi:hypothetical protein
MAKVNAALPLRILKTGSCRGENANQIILLHSFGPKSSTAGIYNPHVRIPSNRCNLVCRNDDVIILKVLPNFYPTGREQYCNLKNRALTFVH